MNTYAYVGRTCSWLVPAGQELKPTYVCCSLFSRLVTSAPVAGFAHYSITSSRRVTIRPTVSPPRSVPFQKTPNYPLKVRLTVSTPSCDERLPSLEAPPVIQCHSRISKIVPGQGWDWMSATLWRAQPMQVKYHHNGTCTVSIISHIRFEVHSAFSYLSL
mgnify:CR=1 FL=1